MFNLTGVLISLTPRVPALRGVSDLRVDDRLDPQLREAAEDLGGGWWTTFRRITLPLTLPGVVAGAQICFTLALGAFVTPAMLGGGRVLVLPLQVYSATTDINWPVAAVGGIVLLLVGDASRSRASTASRNRARCADERAAPPLAPRRCSRWCFTTGAMLYHRAPLAVVVLNSFTRVAYNVFPPEGFSLRWYVNLFAQDVILRLAPGAASCSRRCRPRWRS